MSLIIISCFFINNCTGKMTTDSFIQHPEKEEVSWLSEVQNQEGGTSGQQASSTGGDCQSRPQAVGSVEAAVATGRAAVSEGVTSIRQSPSLGGFSVFEPTRRYLRSYLWEQTQGSACINIYMRVRQKAGFWILNTAGVDDMNTKTRMWLA